MKHVLAALALIAGFASVAQAAEICDINGCHKASATEKFYNEWYLKNYGYTYDAGYRKDGEGNGLGGIGPCFGYGGTGAKCDRSNLPKGNIFNPNR